MVIEDTPTIVPCDPFPRSTRPRPSYPVEGTNHTARWVRSWNGAQPLVEVIAPGALLGVTYTVAELEGHADTTWAHNVLCAVLPGRREAIERGRARGRAAASLCVPSPALFGGSR